MSLKSTRNQQRNTENKKAASGALLPIVVMALIFVIILVTHMFRVNLLQVNYENIDSCLTEALLAGGIVNYHEYGKTGKVMIQSTEEPSPSDYYFLNSYSKFLDCLKTNLALDDGFNVSTDQGVKGKIEVVEYRVYSYISDGDDFFIAEAGLTEGTGYAVKHGVNEKVYVQANDSTVEITETSVYAKIRFTLHLMGYIDWMQGVAPSDVDKEYTLTRLIGVAD